MEALIALDKYFDKALCMLAVAASIIITSCLILLVILRFFFDISIMGMHEASLLAAIWLYMAGAMLATRRRDHLVIDILYNALPKGKARAWHDFFISILSLVIAVFFSFWSWKMLEWGLMRPQTIPVLSTPLWLAQLPIALAAISATIYALRDIIVSMLKIKMISRRY